MEYERKVTYAESSGAADQLFGPATIYHPAGVVWIHVHQGEVLRISGAVFIPFTPTPPKPRRRRGKAHKMRLSSPEVPDV